jgi:hypothetical protein
MATGTSIKNRCRLCYTRLKDTSSLSHHKFCCTQYNNRIYNIYKYRPYRYRDLIVRYLCINLPENHTTDPYSNVICGTCATSLTKLDTAFRTFEQTQKLLRSKFRKTSQIIHYQLGKQLKSITQQEKSSIEEKTSIPKRQSKRKGEPKHIDQTSNHAKKLTSGGTQLIVKIHSPNHDDEESIETQNLFSSPTKRISPRRKQNDDILTETTNQKKRFKRLTKDSESSVKILEKESSFSLCFFSVFRIFHLIHRIMIYIIYLNRVL